MKLIIDSAYASLEGAVRGTKAPKEVIETLALVDVTYVSFDRRVHQGQIVVRKNLEDEVKGLFAGMYELRFPLAKVIPIVKFDWDDEISMADNNSSAFNYRVIMNTERLSKHSFGTAIDLNPAQNPYYPKGGGVYPAGAVYDPDVLGTLTKDHPVVALFKSLGWEWGGDWTDRKDYQHFEKLVSQ